MNPSDDLRQTLADELEAFKAHSLYREPPRPLETTPGPPFVRGGVHVGDPPLSVSERGLGGEVTPLNFGSNDYLGLARHPRVIEAAVEAAGIWGAGSTGSRLTSGTLELHQQAESALADLKHAEAALLFSSGYLAAVGTIPALVGREDLILSDELNHASLIDGCRLSRATVRIYRHSDAAHAAELLADRERFRRLLLVTDGVFSMDGDLAPLPQLCDLCDAVGAWLMVDDAHGTGVLGSCGGGTVEHFCLEGRVPIQMATASKALGAEGGFIAGSAELVDYLRNRARSFIFSTAPAPPTVAAIIASLQVVRDEPERRAALASHAQRLRDGLRTRGLDVPEGIAPIIPVIVGEAARALEASEHLGRRGIRIPAIRPPTVPPGTARLRVTVTAMHTEADIERAIDAIAEAVRHE